MSRECGCGCSNQTELQTFPYPECSDNGNGIAFLFSIIFNIVQAIAIIVLVGQVIK